MILKISIRVNKSFKRGDLDMDFLFVNTQELSALMGLPYVQQIAYLIGIRPYMDRKTFVVGMKRRISYQSLSEALYVEPHQGIQSGSPSRQQLRRIVNGLERAGLVAIQSSDKHLILKCLLANVDNSLQNKADTNPTPDPDTKPAIKNVNKSANYGTQPQKPGIAQITKADTPHNSENNYVCVLAHFEKFWLMYPKKIAKQQALEAFKTLQPSDELLAKIFSGLQEQVNTANLLQGQGCWIPQWKFPVNWLTQHCWEDEINVTPTKEYQHESHPRHPSAPQPLDSFWESCKDGAQAPSGNHVIQRRAL